MTSIDSLADEIVKSLKEYTTEVEEDLEEVEKEVADEAVSELKSSSPKRKGKYAKSWRKKVVKTAGSSLGKSQIVVYNSGHGQLTHLLENGHAKRGGGRVAPIVHIKPVEDKVIKDMESKTRARLQK